MADVNTRMDTWQIIDLSVPLSHLALSEPRPASIHYVTHDQEGQRQFLDAFAARPEDLTYSKGMGWAIEEISAITHTGTHVDAPYHYHPTSEGKPAKTIDQVPLEWCLAPGVRLDIRHKQPGELIEIADLQNALKAADHTLKPRDIALLWTGCDERIDSPAYFAQPGLGREGVLWLAEQGVKVIGIDAYTLDRPFLSMVGDYQATGDGRHLWPAHFAGITKEYCQIEKLANLGSIPRSSGFLVSCLPIKIAKASAGWCRAVALVPP